MKYFISSDIHSAYTPWIMALLNVGFDIGNEEHILIVCGDLFDRMPEPRETFNFAKQMYDRGRLIYVRGNHEDLLKECMEEVRAGKVPSMHHFSNGTVETICRFCGQSEWIIYDPTYTDVICETMQPILDFIDKACVDYYETNDCIFIHSCLPIVEVGADWRNADEKSWKDARWGNPFLQAASRGRCANNNKTLVFGHYHVSYARATFNGEPEFGKDANFDIYYGDGFIGLDSCVAYTGKCNVLVWEE